MNAPVSESTIPESFLEQRQVFPSAWVDRWTIPNPFIGRLFSLLRSSGVELTDFSFNKDASNVGDTYLNIAMRKLNSAIRVGLESVTYIVANPDWRIAPQLVEPFDSVSANIQEFTSETPNSQQMTLAFHVAPGTVDLREKTSQLVKRELLGEAVFYGISLHHEHSSVVIDKSLRYEGAAFIRLQRSFHGALTFAEIAPWPVQVNKEGGEAMLVEAKREAGGRFGSPKHSAAKDAF
jgi:hypothetical protein